LRIASDALDRRLPNRRQSPLTIMIAKMKARAFRCSFCGKSKGEVSAIMAGAPQATAGVPRQMIGKSAFICNECVSHYYRILSAPEVSSHPALVPK
jgi:ClpX C4-type zinc finger